MSGLHEKHAKHGLLEKMRSPYKSLIQLCFSAMWCSRVLLDNITQDIEAKGHEFESHRAHHKGFKGFRVV